MEVRKKLDETAKQKIELRRRQLMFAANVLLMKEGLSPENRQHVEKILQILSQDTSSKLAGKSLIARVSYKGQIISSDSNIDSYAAVLESLLKIEKESEIKKGRNPSKNTIFVNMDKLLAQQKETANANPKDLKIHKAKFEKTATPVIKHLEMLSKANLNIGKFDRHKQMSEGIGTLKEIKSGQYIIKHTTTEKKKKSTDPMAAPTTTLPPPLPPLSSMSQQPVAAPPEPSEGALVKPSRKPPTIEEGLQKAAAQPQGEYIRIQLPGNPYQDADLEPSDPVPGPFTPAGESPYGSIPAMSDDEDPYQSLPPIEVIKASTNHSTLFNQARTKSELQFKQEIAGQIFLALANKNTSTNIVEVSATKKEMEALLIHLHSAAEKGVDKDFFTSMRDTLNQSWGNNYKLIDVVRQVEKAVSDEEAKIAPRAVPMAHR